jgi:hypothetical protein
MIAWLCALTALAPQSFAKGIQDGWCVGDDLRPILTDSVAKQMASCGAKWVRINFRLSSGHDSWDKAILGAYATAIGNIERNGMKVLGLVCYESQPGGQRAWIENNAETLGGNGDNPYIRKFAAQTFRVLLKRFPSIRDWEIWNEPNCWTKNPPGDKEKLPGQYYIYPSNFAWLLTHCAAEANQADGREELISGGLLTADFTSDLDANIAAPYLRATFDYGRKFCHWARGAPVNGFGVHLYAGDSALVAPYLRGFEQLVTGLEGLKKEIWVTEVGWQSHDTASDASQADNVTRLLMAAKSEPGCGPVFWFKLTDQPSAKLRYGLVREDGSRKPSFEAFRKG